MPTRVQLPDGNVGEFPDGMSQDQIEAVLKKQFPTPNAAPQPLERTFGNYLTEGVEGIGRGLSNLASGVADTGKMIFDPAGTMVHGIQDPSSNPAVALAKAGKAGYDEFKQTQGTPLGKRLIAAGLTGMEQAPMIGPMVQHAEQGGTQMASPESVGAAAEGTTTIEAPGIAGRVIPPAFRGAADMIAGTGPKVASKMAKTAAKANAEASVEAQAAAAASRQVEAQRTAHQNTISEGTRELQARIETARNNALKQGNEKYNAVNEQLNDFPADMEVIENGIGDAAEKIRGTQKLPAVLNTLQEKIGRGEPLDYNDLQGFYSEMNKELSKGTLAGDDYAAIDHMHDVVGNEMQRIADNHGAGEQLTDARNYWRRMKQTFGKPIAAHDAATETLRTISPEAMRAEEQANRVRLLSHYDPEIERAASDVTQARTGLSSLPKPAPPAVPPNVQTITPEQVAAAKAEALDARAGHIAGRGSWIAAWPLYHVFSAIVRGAPTELGMMGMESGATLAGTQAIARILQNPHAVDFLSKATPRDLAAIPPELRSGNWQPIIDAAKTKGIPISPAVSALVAAPRPQHPTLSAASPVQ